jgi:hypothetical protein
VLLCLRSDIGCRLLDVTPCSHFTPLPSRTQNPLEREIYYIPTDQIQSHYAELQAGDIIAIATSVPGLDVTHTGFVYRSSQGLGLIHAAPSGVKISADLQTYVSRVEAAIGIIVVRPKS